jgi:hypothetical protein
VKHIIHFDNQTPEYNSLLPELKSAVDCINNLRISGPLTIGGKDIPHVVGYAIAEVQKALRVGKNGISYGVTKNIQGIELSMFQINGCTLYLSREIGAGSDSIYLKDDVKKGLKVGDELYIGVGKKRDGPLIITSFFRPTHTVEITPPLVHDHRIHELVWLLYSECEDY